jgi:hypothetical protein
MSTCMCGNQIDTIGTMCSRCGALQTLGLEMNARPQEIEDTWRTLIKVWHPDRFQSDPKLRNAAEEKIKEVNAAHDYLTSEPTSGSRNRGVPKPEPPSQPEAPADPVIVPGRQPEEEEPEEVRRLRKRLRRRSRPKIFLKVFIAFTAVAAAGLLVFSLDFFLSANATTARPWEELKTDLSRNLHASGLRLWSNATGNMHGANDQNPEGDEPSAPAISATPALAKTESPVRHSPTTSKAMSGAKPYVTTGLSPMEVVSILGNPTSSSGEKMFYKGSEINFRNGQVAGWKIEPGIAAIRVKLWPASPLAPGVTTFGPGSTKSDVIALQGTPNLFSDNEFGYGSSTVFFKHDRVTGWKENPASVRLQVAH